MRTSEYQDTGLSQSKQRLRAEISNHVEDFLHKGGRIEVVDKQSLACNGARIVHRPAAADLSPISSMLDE